MSKVMLKYLLTIWLFTLTLYALPNDNNKTETFQKALTKNSSKILKSIPNKRFLKKFYRQNHYTPLWIEKNQLNQKKYQKLFKIIKSDITLNQNGLIYKNYQSLTKTVESNLTQTEIFHTELKLSSLYYNFLLHSIYGEIEWKSFNRKLTALKRKRINTAWITSKPKFNLIKIMQEQNLTQTIAEIRPKQFGYNGLLLALKKLQMIKAQKAWKPLPSFKRVALGSMGEVIPKLRSRLQLSGDYIECNQSNPLKIQDNNLSNNKNLSSEAIFGHCLEKAIKNFQARHGLIVDGIVGKGTQAALNLSVDAKIEKVLLNIDRIKWLPRLEKKRFIVVNIPEFMLHYIEDNQTKQKLPVIVGDKKHHTPIFSENISYIVLNPYWKIPNGIVKHEVIPSMVKNSNYLRRHGLEVRRTWSENSRRINPNSIYWEDYLHGFNKFPYRIMQPPGPKNALGKIKFKFPNRFAVYLHDTPTRYLFKKTVRAFSHGCVRLSNPTKLLETIAKFNPKINLQKSKKILKGKHKVQLNMAEKLPIYLVYLTAGLNQQGQLEFRNDIYNYDKYQKRRLR